MENIDISEKLSGSIRSSQYLGHKEWINTHGIWVFYSIYPTSFVTPSIAMQMCGISSPPSYIQCASVLSQTPYGASINRACLPFMGAASMLIQKPNHAGRHLMIKRLSQPMQNIQKCADSAMHMVSNWMVYNNKCEMMLRTFRVGGGMPQSKSVCV
jgi:hypothetical protein